MQTLLAAEQHYSPHVFAFSRSCDERGFPRKNKLKKKMSRLKKRLFYAKISGLCIQTNLFITVYIYNEAY